MGDAIELRTRGTGEVIGSWATVGGAFSGMWHINPANSLKDADLWCGEVFIASGNDIHNHLLTTIVMAMEQLRLAVRSVDGKD